MNATQKHSTLVEPGTVRLERLLPGPLERVWAYITEPKKRAMWICGGTIDLRVGGKMHMEFDNNSLTSDKSPPPKYQGRGKHTSPGLVTRLEPMRVFAHTWTWESGDTEVTYELAPRGKDVLLTIVHSKVKGRDATASVMGGWDVHTGVLEDVLRGAEPRPFWATHTKLEKEYDATLQ
jgi:uncharacterized protein YndB with AHSA1/START domain